jgi:hypothetical protein
MDLVIKLICLQFLMIIIQPCRSTGEVWFDHFISLSRQIQLKGAQALGSIALMCP